MFENWFNNRTKKHKLSGHTVVSKKDFLLSRNGAEKRYRNKAGMRKPEEPCTHYGTMLAPSLASNAMHLHP